MAKAAYIAGGMLIGGGLGYFLVGGLLGIFSPFFGAILGAILFSTIYDDMGE